MPTTASSHVLLRVNDGFGSMNEPAYAGARCARGGVRGNDGVPAEIG